MNNFRQTYLKIAVMCMLVCAPMCLCVCAEVGQTGRVVKLTYSIQQLHRKGQYVQAMDSAVTLLIIDKDNAKAVNYIHSHWDRMVRYADTKRQELADMSLSESVARATERRDLYAQLVDIYSGLRYLPLPLHDRNYTWSWQPDYAYYDADLGAAERHLERLLLQQSEEAADTVRTIEDPIDEVLDDEEYDAVR